MLERDPSNILQDNLIEFFDWAILDAGGFKCLYQLLVNMAEPNKPRLVMILDTSTKYGRLRSIGFGKGVSTTDQPNTITKIKPEGYISKRKNYPECRIL